MGKLKFRTLMLITSKWIIIQTKFLPFLQNGRQNTGKKTATFGRLSVTVSCNSIAVIHPLSTAEVERIFSQVALIKSSHRANIKTETHSKILNIKYNCDQTLF
jgi:hypothetical protein